VNDPSRLPAFPAAERWATQLAGWAIPAEILDRAPASPWGLDPARFVVDDTTGSDDVSTRWAREVLPPMGATVLDIGCGGGRASLPLAPPATEVVGVDHDPAMLALFSDAAAARGIARRAVHGAWPDVADVTPIADVVICRHVVYDVADIAPFLLAATVHARLAVVVELTAVHPMSAWTPAWEHFWGVRRPAGPTTDDLIAVVRELGFDPEIATAPRGSRSDPGPSDLVGVARRRLCLPAERDAELAAWLADHPPAWVETMTVLRWPGAAEPTV
jgi:SAM-dependent methyltransferase